MTFRIRDYSITAKLTWMNVLASAAALLLASTAFVAYEVMSFRHSMVRALSIRAQIVGLNSVSTLLFNDPESAKNTLAALQADPHVISAGIYTPDGRPFAGYWRGGSGEPPPLPENRAVSAEAYWFKDRQLTLVRPITLQGRLPGTVLIQSDLEEMDSHLRQYAAIGGVVLLASIVTGLWVSSVLRRAIADPIVSLADTARIVSGDKKYSVRAPVRVGRDELSILIEAFNEMLDQIQERDGALQQAHDQLERRVEERTAQLNSANKELEAFSYSVSHDLRAPLRQIDGFSQVLLEQFGSQLDETGRRYLGLVRSGAKNMGQLVDDLLEMGRIGRHEVTRRVTDLNALVDGVLLSLQPEWEGRQIEWHIGALPALDCDPGLMKQVFANLLSNAVKYTGRRERAVIEVGHTGPDGISVIFVRDNGAGFEQQYAHKLFGVFQRLHRAEEFEGTGVGLATVQRIVQKHGGRIWAEGKVDKGATFFFTLGTNHINEDAPSGPGESEANHAAR